MKTGPSAEPILPVLLAPLRAHPGRLLALVLWSLVESVPALLTGHLVARAVDQGFAEGKPLTGLAWLAAMGLAVFAGAWGTRQAYPLLADFVEPFRDDLVRTVTDGALRQAVSGRTADASGASRLTLQVEMVREAYAGILMVVRGFLLTVGGALIGLGFLAPAVLIVVVPPLLAGIGLFLALLGRMAGAQRNVIIADEQVAEAVGAASAAGRDIVACGAEDTVRAELLTHIDAQAAAGRRLAAMMPLRVLCLAVAGWLPLLLLLMAAPGLRADGMSVGAVLGAATYVTGELQPAVRSLIQGLGGSGLRLVVALRRIREANPPLLVPTELTPSDRGAPARSDAYAVELAAVTFSYAPHADPVLRDLDLTLPEDGHLAVVGPSGIGKSTLAGLISGTLRPDHGGIRIGGRQPGAMSLAELSAVRVLVPQEAYVFSGDLIDNLRYLRPDASDQEVVAAVEAVGAGPLVARLGGTDARIDADTLSSGERQLIALARAHLSPAPIAVLDEATCHLDPATEARAEEAFARRPGSLVVIAHRISSALRARHVLVMDGTRLASGTHQEVLELSPLYREMVGHWNGDGHERPTEDVAAVRANRPRSRS